MSDFIVDRLRYAHDKNPWADFIISPGKTITYAEAWITIHKLGAALEAVDLQSHFIGVLADRDVSAYYGTLAAINAGRGYVSLTAKNPVPRLKKMAAAVELKTVFIGKGMEKTFIETFHDFLWPVTGICVESTTQTTTGNAIIVQQDIAKNDRPVLRLRPILETDALYILFTSGSTGEPKGVPVSNKNVASYLDFICPRYSYGPQDRLSQTFDLSFDLSVHDMMCAWTTGAALVPFSAGALLSPARIIKECGVTSWFSVPSQASLMSHARNLSTGNFPHLRVSLFCGEAFPARLAEEWAQAAPNSLIENLYGPTEATIAIMYYKWDGQNSSALCRRGVVPIGRAFEGQGAEVFDENLKPAYHGELMLSGSQLFHGYWKNPNITAEKIHIIDGKTWYRTGDIAERDEEGCIHFVGRADTQVKFRGHRIELAEIENVLRTLANTDFVVVLPWPVQEGVVKSLTAVVSGTEDKTVLASLKERLPAYMVPEKIVYLDTFPTNLSGKVDRNAITKIVEEKYA